MLIDVRRSPSPPTGSMDACNSEYRCSPAGDRRRSRQSLQLQWRTCEPRRDGDAAESNAEGAVADAEDDLPVPGGDLNDLLRACLMSLRLPAGTAAYQPRRLPFWTIGEAVARIARLLDDLPEGAELRAVLPEIATDVPSQELRCPCGGGDLRGNVRTDPQWRSDATAGCGMRKFKSTGMQPVVRATLPTSSPANLILTETSWTRFKHQCLAAARGGGPHLPSNGPHAFFVRYPM